MTATIYALASAAGRAGVAVWRLSGDGAGPALAALTGRPLPAPRRAMRVRLADPSGDVIDDGLALWFPAPQSFTGEDVAELHLHGGRAVAQALAEALGRLGLRPAEPGEFTRRAFLNGKMDLTRAEAIADLVDAETAAQRRQALRQMDGGLARLADSWRERVVGLLAWLEAEIDFADEDIPAGLMDQVAGAAAALAGELAGHLADNRRGERLRDGIHIAILGAPNAGKSSLLNRLAGRDAAIVSAQAGTTRDVIEVHLDLGGWPVVLADTAGLRDAACDVEAEGVRRALARAEAADLKLAVLDGATLDLATLAVIDDATLVVANKADIGACPDRVAGRPVLAVSARTGQGIDAMVRALEDRVAARFAVTSAPMLTRVRHRAAVEECREALARFDPRAGAELAAEDLRLAARAIGRITGRIEVDDILDVIFREFCIGK
ncbi:tRNA uridine-5-carboxymethylaminomethyl(34) synthesis GTPase MnmE [Magnetospirillum sp. SS-4]|uniref:tRNA uridine-5-carboxymethylaminomethyl(34) synthesis GTPase MnmE n=1 Tax=Magnetospirillum sp. SS-4 TaxID=2681465 RepID=UPI0013845A5F|nr:tRNA uridine-5-carboxymethylaminomethyl(34) synthesis GTPase MnmE [Magnetospirillum sp. SS-4]CAA7621109.1 tRNA modification GTPase MnmE [Magnetospirillum sp. SS-4]